MNRDRTKINWKFDRKAARRKFGYKKELFQAVKDLEYVDIFHRKHKTFSSFQIIAAVVSTGTAAHIVPGPVLNDKDY